MVFLLLMLLANPLGKVLDDLAATRRFRDVSISPDGARLAWVEDTRPGDSSLFLSGTNLGEGSNPVWSPDGSRVAFLSDRAKDGQMQLYVARAAGGSARPVTRLKGAVAAPRWAPDGTQIAFLHIEGATGPAGPVEAISPLTGVAGENLLHQRLAVVDLASGAMRQVSPPDLYVYEYDWSPDGRRFAAIAAPAPGDANWYVAQLYTIDAASGRTLSICRPGTQIAIPRWSPAGDRIAFIGGLMSDEGSVGGDIFAVPAGGGEPRNLTRDRPSSPGWLAWMAPDEIVFTEHVDGGSAIATLNPATGQARTLWTGDENITGGGFRANFSLARDGRASAITRASWSAPPEIWSGPIGQWRQVTKANASLHPHWGRAQNLTWTSDGFRVQGWLLYPRPFDPSRRYPMVVSVHGGPAGVVKPGWPGTSFETAVLASQGYFVLYPNPRGSFGQGQAFTRANVKDFGGGDLRDILAGVDAALHAAPIDPRRIGITGWSYGGYMTMWALTQTDRFRAGVAGAGVANWKSYYGQNAIDQWLLPYFGASVYDDPAVYAKSSPIEFIKRVRTPTLIVVGERDGECPLPQSQEYWHALKTLGVPTQLVVYPGEGHAFRKPEHRRNVVERAVQWFDKYLAATPAAGNTLLPGLRRPANRPAAPPVSPDLRATRSTRSASSPAPTR